MKPLLYRASWRFYLRHPWQLGLAILGIGLGVAVYVAGLAWLGLDARRRGRARLAPAALLLLVTTPWLAAWYTAWAVPLAALEDDDRVRLATLVLCAYLLPQAIPL